MLKEFAAFRKEICHFGFIGDLIAFEQAAQFFLYLIFHSYSLRRRRV